MRRRFARVRAVLAARRNTTLVLLAAVALAGTFAYRTQAQRAPGVSLPGSEPPSARILIADAGPQSPAPAAAPVQPSGPVHVITFVDITPNNKDNGTELCKQFIADTRKEAGVTRAELLVQTNRPNHMVMDIVYQNQAAYEKHEGAQSTKNFNNKLIPIIGAPLDERPHYALQ